MPNEGQVAVNKKTGARAVFRNGVWVAEKPDTADAGMRGRVSLGLAPMINAETSMNREEASGVNPLERDWGATALSVIPFVGDYLAGKTGGQDYQNYTQGASAFEAQLMPIMSGAAVSEGEARRQIRASLPKLEDTPETLANKSRDRKSMINAAAAMKGLPLPFPDVPVYGLNTLKVPAAPKTRDQKNQALKAKSAAKASGGFKILGVEN